MPEAVPVRRHADGVALLEGFDTPYVSVRDRGRTTYDDYGPTGVPETCWVDARGRSVAFPPRAVSLDDGIAGGVDRR